MAGDWLKIREDLHEDPAVVRIATWMKVRPEVVVGYLVRFWGWVSRNSTDGVVANLSLDEIEGVLNLPHFLGFLCRVGWLEVIEGETETQVIVPKFDRHLSNPSKARALKTRQKQLQRHKNDTANDVAKMSPSCRQNVSETGDQRREEKRRDKYIRATFVAPSVGEVVAYCREKNLTAVDAGAFVDHFESNGWKVGGKTKMKDWQAAVRNWDRRNKADSPPRPELERINMDEVL